MTVATDRFVICKGIRFLQLPMTEAPGRFLFGIKESQSFPEILVHGRIVIVTLANKKKKFFYQKTLTFLYVFRIIIYTGSILWDIFAA